MKWDRISPQRWESGYWEIIESRPASPEVHRQLSNVPYDPNIKYMLSRKGLGLGSYPSVKAAKEAAAREAKCDFNRHKANRRSNGNLD